MARQSERPSEPPETGGIGRWIGGCAVAFVALVLIVGAIGIGVGALQRFGRHAEAPIDALRDAGSEVAGEDPAPPPERDPLEEMRLRYRPGRFVRLDSMVPSGRLLPSIVPGTPPQPGRTVDNPWIVPGAGLEPATMPAPSSVNAPSIWHDPSERADQPLGVVTRSPEQVLVRSQDAAGGAGVVAYAIEFVGYSGHLELPATLLTELGQVRAPGSDGATIRFALSAPIRPGGAPAAQGETFFVTMRIAAIDDQGRVSPPIERQLQVVAVGNGDVEVTLTMSQPTDLDLYVIDPAGVTIYFGNTTSISGGRLDLDANAACSSNLGIDHEHVFWPRAGAPSGTYRVRAANYQSCIASAPVDYRVSVNVCGETVVLSGHFDGPAHGGRCLEEEDRVTCQDVVAFDVPPCP